MSGIETYIVDSFTDKPFKGNPAGVCLIKQELGEGKMLSIAQELGLSETAFVGEINGGQGFSIRFFSPKMEIALCGHATLAASKVLFEKLKDIPTIRFVNIDGLDLMVRRNNEDLIMEFPVYKTIPGIAPPKLLEALGIGQIVNCAFNSETNILLLELSDPEVLRNLKPDFEALRKSHDAINGVLVTAPSDKTSFEFESRYFWPWSGTNEDPVTGGTHTFLAKYWGDRLDKTKMNSFQCSERTGFMEVELLGDGRMTIKGMAQIVLKGELLI